MNPLLLKYWTGWYWFDWALEEAFCWPITFVHLCCNTRTRMRQEWDYLWTGLSRICRICTLYNIHLQRTKEDPLKKFYITVLFSWSKFFRICTFTQSTASCSFFIFLCWYQLLFSESPLQSLYIQLLSGSNNSRVQTRDPCRWHLLFWLHGYQIHWTQSSIQRVLNDS